MSANETAIGPAATNITVSPQPSLVTDIITSNFPNASPASGASTPFADPQAVTGTQGNAFVAAVKTSVLVNQTALCAGAPSVIFANPA